MTRRGILRIAALLSVAGGFACSDQGPILIGLAGPMAQDRGVAMRQGAQLAVTEINRAGGIGGREIRLVVKDDSADTEAAVRAARELYDDDVVAVVGHLTSGTSSAAATIYNGGNDPLTQISPTASSPTLTLAGDFTFRICPSDLVHGARLADWAINELQASTAAILYQDAEYGRGIRNAFAANFQSLGGSLVTDDPYLDELPSFEPFLRILQSRGGADVLLIAGTRAAAERIVPTLDSVNLDVQVIAGDAVAGLEDSDVPAVGILISSAYLPDRDTEQNDSFVDAYRALHNRSPDNRAAGAYDVVQLIADAVRNVGTDRADIRDHVAGIGESGPPFEGVTGRIAFDDNGDVVGKSVIVGVVATTGIVTVRGQ